MSSRIIDALFSANYAFLDVSVIFGSGLLIAYEIACTTRIGKAVKNNQKVRRISLPGGAKLIGLSERIDNNSTEVALTSIEVFGPDLFRVGPFGGSYDQRIIEVQTVCGTRLNCTPDQVTIGLNEGRRSECI
jgi:hypothetical protein